MCRLQPPSDMAKQPEYSWGSYLMPWEIAWNGQRWVDEHLTMQDVREGFRSADSPRSHVFMGTPIAIVN